MIHYLQTFNCLPRNVNVMMICPTDQALAWVVAEAAVATIAGKEHELIWSYASEDRKVAGKMAPSIYEIEPSLK